MLFPFSLRPRASSSSSQSERSASPLVMNSTQSLDVMPRFAISAEEEGETDRRGPLCTLFFCYLAFVKDQWSHSLLPDPRWDGLQLAAHPSPQ